MLIEKRKFYKGMNGDISTRLLDDETSLNLMNCRMAVSEGGRDKRIENLYGTTQVSQAVFPPYGVQQCIGSCIDEPRNRILFFEYNTHGDHGIYAWDYLTDTIYAVLYDSQVIGGLNFDKNYRIDRNCKVVGDLLYWTDNLNPPRRINVEAGIKMNTASYSTSVTPYSWPMNQSVIDLIRRPFGLAVTATKATVGGVTENYIKLFAGQFASQFIYRDGEYTVFSPSSNMINYNFSGDTFNAINVTFPLTETFDQDVQVIRLAVRYDNSFNYFVIKEWDKDNATDLAEINAHNSGSTALTYQFLNDKTGIAISETESIKIADSIGTTVKTLEFANNRLFLANYVKGYDTPTTTSLEPFLTVDSGDPGTGQSFKRFSSYQIAIRFRDKAKRQCAVVTNNGCLISIPDRDYAFTTSIGLGWSVTNAAALTEIPDWAYYYDILITKNLRTRYFIQTFANLQYVKKNQDGTFTYTTTYDSSVYAIGVNMQFANGLGYFYTFTSGDLCRLYLGNTATVYEKQVIGQDGNYVLIQPDNLGSLNPQPGSEFEIYTPYFPSLNETFYTTGQTYLVTNPTTNSRTYSTTTGTFTGDTTRFSLAPFLITRYEGMSPNVQTWQNWVGIFGEANIQSQLGQVDKTNFISWSDVKIIGSQTNGLSSFDSLNEKALPVELGEINKLQLTNKISDLGQGNIMLAICPTETASLYLSETQLMAAARQGDVATSTDVIGSINVLNGSRGTTHPETVIAIWGLVFWYDLLNGIFVQYSPNGLEDVSRYGMSIFFKNYAKGYLAANANNLDNINGFHHIPTCANPFYKELICTLPALIYENYANTLPSYSSVPDYATSIIDRFDIYDQLGKSMAFCFEENKWGSNYEHLAEHYDYIDNRMVAWKNGIPYKHDADSANTNNFYGTTYPVRMCFTGNLNPSLLKDLSNIAIESNAVPDFSVAMTNYPNNQISDLAANDFINQQGIFYATWLMDRLSPNSVGTPDEKLYTGDQLTDVVIMVMLEFQQYSGLFYTNFVNLGYQPSRGNKQIANTING